MQKEMYIEIDYGELEELIKKHFDVPEYEILCDLEAYNDSHKVIYVEAKEFDEEDEYYTRIFKEWLDSKGRKGTYMTHQIMCKMAKDGVLEEGNYLINIYW